MMTHSYFARFVVAFAFFTAVCVTLLAESPQNTDVGTNSLQPEPASGILDISTTPSNVSVWINDILYGQTPLTLTLPAGIYCVRLQKEPYGYADSDIKIRAGERQKIQTDFLRWVFDHCEPDFSKKASVSINGVTVGETPCWIWSLSDGVYWIGVNSRQVRFFIQSGRGYRIAFNTETLDLYDSHLRREMIKEVQNGERTWMPFDPVNARLWRQAFLARTDLRKTKAIQNGASNESEKAVDDALAWLARNQEPDGHWDNIKHAGSNAMHDPALTALALLAFLGAGHTENSGEHQQTVRNAVRWIRESQKENGSYADGWGYNHAICGLAMAEAAGTRCDPKTVESAQKAVFYSAYIHQIRNGDRLNGWRYAPNAPIGSISVSSWFVMQLFAASYANLVVPQESLEGASRFLDLVEDDENLEDPSSRHRYNYVPEGDNASAILPTGTRTAMGILCRQLLGSSGEELDGGVQYMLKRSGLPSWGDEGYNADWYSWFYVNQVLYHIGGKRFEEWNNSIRDLTCEKQIKGGDDDGSWNPTGRYESEGRVFSTAMATLCLEVYYRYPPLCR